MIRFLTYLEELNKPKELSILRKNLRHVKNVDTRDTSWMTTLPDLFGKYGFKRVGSGKYGTVFINPKYKYAVKVFMRDAAYQRWIDFCLKNPKNPYCPKIRGKIVKITPLVYAIRIEKLQPYSYGGGNEFLSHMSQWKKNSNYVSGDKNIDDVLAHFQQNKRLLDLHGENMMMRGNQLVIIDPYYNWFNRSNPMDYEIDPNEVIDDLF